MKILGIDSASPLGGLALFENGQPIAALVSTKRLTHAENLLPEVDGLLKRVQWQLDDLEGIGVITGPGSFTGVRIGIATAMGLQAGLSIPTIGVSALYAYALAHPYARIPICPLLDLRRGRVYSALFDTSSGKPVELLPQGHYELNELLEKVPREIMAVGEGARLSEATCRAVLGEGYRLPLTLGNLGLSGVAAANCGEILRGGGASEVLSPLYLQASAAEANLKKARLS